MSFLSGDHYGFSYNVRVAKLGISYVKMLFLMNTLSFVVGAKPESQPASRKMTKNDAIFPSFHYTFSDLLPHMSSQWSVGIELTIYQTTHIDEYFYFCNWRKVRISPYKPENGQSGNNALDLLLLLLCCFSSLSSRWSYGRRGIIYRNTHINE